MAVVHGVMGVRSSARANTWLRGVAMLPYVEEVMAIANRFEYLP